MGKERERGPGKGAVRSVWPQCRPLPRCKTFSGQIRASARAAGLGEPLESHAVGMTEGLCVSFCLQSSGSRVFVCILAFRMLEPKML